MNIQEHVEGFAEVTRTHLEQFGVPCQVAGGVETVTGLNTDKDVSVSIPFSASVSGGVLSGEYILALDERVAAILVGLVPEDASLSQVKSHRDICCDAVGELLNTIVGQVCHSPAKTAGTVHIATPRMCFGTSEYKALQMNKTSLRSPIGEVECFFHSKLSRDSKVTP